MSPAEIALELIKLVINLIGIEAAHSMVLSQKAILEANAAADALEEVKFGPGKGTQ